MAKNSAYFPQLDALRTLAVVLTLAAHFLPAVGWPLLPYSWYGVDIFFTISGFLITYILLLSKESDSGRMHIIKNFVIRRSLRLFPVYYLFLLFFFLAWKFMHLQMWKADYSAYFFTYTPNFLFYTKGLEYAPGFSHLWSLGVEEQFYLFWPWIVIFFNKRSFLVAIVLFILIGITTHVAGFRAGDVRLLPFGNFHTLGVGAFLAYLYQYKAEEPLFKSFAKYRVHFFLGSFLLLITVLYFFKEGDVFWQLLRETSLPICTFSVVLASIFGWKGYVSKVANNIAVQYIGRISYGVYLFHLPVPYFFIILKDKTGIGISNPFLLLSVYTISTIVIASFSYHFFERRFLNLKSRFA